VPFVVRSLETPERMLVGSEAVTLRAGPSPDFPAVGELDARTEYIASARARGPGGSSWIEITAENGTVGFVPDGTVQAAPASPPAIEPAAAPEQAATPEIESASAPKQAPTPKIERAAAPKQTSTPKTNRAVASKQAPKVKRAAASKQAATARVDRASKPAQRSRPETAPAPSGIACILRGGEEIRTTRSDCRAQSGIIYQ
jgi:hypothetical protein